MSTPPTRNLRHNHSSNLPDAAAMLSENHTDGEINLKKAKRAA
jgi:hypothetical protein